MKDFKFRYFFTLVLLAMVQLLNGQDCKDYHKRVRSDCAEFTYNEYKYYGQSAGALVEEGKKVNMQVVFYGGKDYSVSLCTENKLYPIHYRIIELSTKEVLYDNKNDDYINGVKFGIENTKTLIIEITAIGKGKRKMDEEPVVGCLGVLIGWKKTADIGFD